MKLHWPRPTIIASGICHPLSTHRKDLVLLVTLWIALRQENFVPWPTYATDRGGHAIKDAMAKTNQNCLSLVIYPLPHKEGFCHPPTTHKEGLGSDRSGIYVAPMETIHNCPSAPVKSHPTKTNCTWLRLLTSSIKPIWWCLWQVTVNFSQTFCLQQKHPQRQLLSLQNANLFLFT